jgi:hypothetical protein
VLGLRGCGSLPFQAENEIAEGTKVMNKFAPWGVLLLAAAVTALFMGLGQSNLVAPSGASGTGFSQERAVATLSSLLKEERPHVTGSPENAIVRDRILEHLRGAGYTPETQAVFQCGPPDRFPGCTQIENIIAVHKGTGTGKALLVTAHYDSVGAGPGVSDDGAGTAIVLELARAFVGRTTKNDVIFLITDGEETGLRGALAFAMRHPLMAKVGLVLNVEARGASGPSMMFETGPGNAKLIEFFAGTVARPVSNSLLYEIYKRMPNNTDFTIYREAGLGGYNFAFTGSGALYHSERDNLANIDRDTLQHHGDNAFALSFKLADADLAALKSPADASYFDLFGRTLLVWPAGLNLPMAVVAALAVMGLMFAHRTALSIAAVGWAVVAFLAVPLILYASGWLLSYPLGHWPGTHPIDHPDPWPARTALASAAIAAGFIVALLMRRIDARAVLLTIWLLLALGGVVLAWFVTGASFLLVWPALAVAIVGWIETSALRTQTLWITGMVGLLASAFFWVPYMTALDVVVSFQLSDFKLLAITPFVLALVACASTSKGQGSLAVPIAAAVCALVAAVVASQTPAYAVNHPRGLNVTYYDDRTASPRWLVNWVGATDEAYLKRTGFPATDERYLRGGLFEAEGRFKPAADLKLDPPTFTISNVEANGALAVAHGVLRAGRGGTQLAFGIPKKSGIRSIRVMGEELVNMERLDRDEPTLAGMLGLGTRDIPVEITFDAKTQPSFFVIERSALPDSAEGTALLAARPTTAAPVHAGNGAVVIVRSGLAPPPKP